MIDVKTAVNVANNYFLAIKDKMGDLQNVRLEEVELSEDRKYWLITLGFDISKNRIKNKKPSGIGSGIAGLMQEVDLLITEYKVFKVNSETSEVEAMKIRKL